MTTIEGLSAEFVNGMYVGRIMPTKVEPYPTFARVHAALTAAAAVASDDPNDLPDAAVTALQWLENNPPVYLSIPEWQFYTGRTPTVNFRKVGTLNSKSTARETGKSPYIYGSSLNGPMMWGWPAGSVPGDVAQTLRAITADVGYLGDNTSKVLMQWRGDLPLDEMTHKMGEHGIGVVTDMVAAPGRLAELSARYRRTRDTSWGSHTPPKEETAKKRDVLQRNADLRNRVGTVRYLRIAAETIDADANVPWPIAVWIPTHHQMADDDLRDAADRIHRSLVWRFSDLTGEKAPSVLTGKYTKPKDGEPPVERRANNVAIQFIPDVSGRSVGHARGTGPGVLLLIPSGVAGDLRDRLLETALAVGSDRIPGSIGSPEIVDASRWWDSPEPGRIRVWETYPLAAADHQFERVSYEKVGGSGRTRQVVVSSDPITVETAASKAIGFVLRDVRPETAPRLVSASAASAVNPWAFSRRDPNRMGTVRAKDSQKDRHPRPSSPPVLFRAAYILTGTLPETAVCAVGRVRHFGSGLLLPADIAVGDHH